MGIRREAEEKEGGRGIVIDIDRGSGTRGKFCFKANKCGMRRGMLDWSMSNSSFGVVAVKYESLQWLRRSASFQHDQRVSYLISSDPYWSLASVIHAF